MDTHQQYADWLSAIAGSTATAETLQTYMGTAIATRCPDCGTPIQVRPDPHGAIRPELQCAACPQCSRIYRVQLNLA